MKWIIWIAFWAIMGRVLGEVIIAIRTRPDEKSRKLIPYVWTVWAVFGLVVLIQLIW